MVLPVFLVKLPFLLFKMLLKLLLLDKRRWPSGRRSSNVLLMYSVKLPPPFGYSLLSKRENCFLFVFNMLLKLRLLDKRR